MKTASNLLTQRRFLPYFITQALGAFNDNVFKNILLIMAAFAGPDVMGISGNVFINLAAGLFILPFFLFSAFAGELADKFEKARFIRRVKLFEIVIMAFAAIALIYQHYPTLLLLLFLMGTQSSFFGPVKYALLPQTLQPQELVSGNALVETGTFIAILFGTILAGVISVQEQAKEIAAFTVVFLAILGYVSSRYIPEIPAGNTQLTLRFSPIRQIKTTLAIARKDKVIYQSILGISWFWFLGASYLTQFPNYTQLYLAGNEASVSFLLGLFSIGVAIGSLLCKKLSGPRIEFGIVPIGAFGLTLFGAQLALSTPDALPYADSFFAFIREPRRWWIFFNLLMIGISGGIFIVPLYSMMQSRAISGERAQVIAANNIYNALFMVLSAALAILLLGQINQRIDDYFLTLSIINILVVLYIARQMPMLVLRFIIYLLSHSVYRVNHHHLENIPSQGGVLLVANHVSFVDALLLGGVCPRPIRFVIDEKYYHLPGLNYLFRACRTIPISFESTTIRRALSAIKSQLAAGDVVCIFPEGELTPDGNIHPFKRGIDLILKQTPVPVIPVALTGLWGSYFSLKGGCTWKKRPRRFWSKINIIVGKPIAPQNATRQHLFTVINTISNNNDAYT